MISFNAENRVGCLHSDLTHLHQELLVCNRLFKVIPVVHFLVQFDTVTLQKSPNYLR